MILLSLALVVATATTLAWGVIAASDPLVWVSLAAGLGAVALVAGSVVRHRRHPVPEAIPDAGQSTTGSATVGAASAGTDPAPSPTPTRSVPATPAAGPVSPPGAWPGVYPVTQTQPTSPAAGSEPAGGPQADPPAVPSAGPRAGWTGPVPVTPPTADPPATDPTALDPTAPTAPEATAPEATAPDPAAPDPAAPEPAAPGATGPEASAPESAASAPADAPAEAPLAGTDGDPGVEQVAVRDALRVAQLADEVLVVDGHPRYHLAGCPTLQDARTVELAVSAARRGGFTPCAVCRPDATLLTRSRARTQQQAQDRATERPSDEGQQL